MKTKLKAGVIGLGRAGFMHLRNITSMTEIEIVAVADVMVDKLSESLDELNIPKDARYADYKDLLKQDDVEAVFIFTSTNTHEEIVLEAAKHKKHIMCEKPLSMSLDEKDTINVLKVVKENGVKLQMAFNRRFDPQFRKTYEMVRAGKIGDPQIVKITSRDPDLLPHDLILRIGTLIFDFTMHDFDMARYMMGSEVVEVYAKGNTLIDPTLKNINDVDTLVIVLQFANGGYAIIDNSRKAVYGYDQRVEVFGSKGMLKAENYNASTVEYYNEDSVELAKPLPMFQVRYTDAYKNEVKMFANSILNDEPIVCVGLDALKAQRIGIAAQKSLETGQPVKIDIVEEI